MRKSICPSSDKNTFDTRNIKKCEHYVLTIQRRLDRAVANDDKPKIRRYLYLLTMVSRAAKILAVYRVTKRNDGKYTAGVDGIAIPRNGNQDKVRHELLRGVDSNKRPDHIKRVFIPKPNGKLRPLGIPTLSDRIAQEIIRQAIEPICEFHFHESSYGFRPKRSCHDAVEGIFKKMSHKTSRQWVIEGDIKGCFDNINHQHITNTLKSWKVSDKIIHTIDQMLRSKIVFDGELMDSETGTPQGGIISPLLANVALTGLDRYCQRFGRKHGKQRVSPSVRYADDFVILCETKESAEDIKQKVTRYLRPLTGLELSDEKTRITHISEGFNFLGFNFKKYGGKLLIKPQPEKVETLKHKVKRVLNELKESPPAVVIHRLNPIITGWGMYYRHAVSKETFSTVENYVWHKVQRWSVKKFAKRSWKWIKGKCFGKGTLTDEKTGKTVFSLDTIPIKRFTKVNSNYRVYDRNAVEYWDKREFVNSKYSVLGNGELSSLFGKQKGKCAYCKSPITQEEINSVQFHKHHIKPMSEGGTNQPSNLRLLHTSCHQEIHSMFTRKQMSQFTDNGIDYLRLMKKVS